MSQSTNAWNKIFEQNGRVFTEPHEDMAELVRLLKDKQADTVLDLGCGAPRGAIKQYLNGKEEVSKVSSMPQYC